MEYFMSSIIENRRKYYLKATSLKDKLFHQLHSSSSDCLELFDQFYEELTNCILNNKESLLQVRKMALYLICQLMGIIISKGASERDINAKLMIDYYSIDTSNSISDVLSSLKKACVKIILFKNDSEQLQNKSKVISETIDYVNSNVNSKLTLSSIASSVNYSTHYLSHRFEEETGIKLWDYIRKVKIEKAKLLLHESYNINDVANLLSYGSTSYFIECFKKETGITPLQYQVWIKKNQLYCLQQ